MLCKAFIIQRFHKDNSAIRHTMGIAIVLSLLFSLGLYTQADEAAVKTRVYTHNGNTFVGELLEYKQGEYLQLRLSSGHIIRLQDAQIKRIVQKVRAPYTFEQRKYFYHIRGGLLASSDGHGLGIAHDFGLQYNRLWGIGLGVGIDKYFDGLDIAFYTVHLNLRSYFLAQNKTPYVRLNAGYGFAKPLDSGGYVVIVQARGGLMLEAASGIRFGGHSGAFTFDMGIKMQKATFSLLEDLIGQPRRVVHKKYLRTSFHVGWLF